MQLKLSKKRLEIFGSSLGLVGLLALTVVGNQSILDSLSEGMGRLTLGSLSDRGPASFETFRNKAFELRQIEIDQEHELAQRLALKNDRNTASLGRAASPIENLRFGILEGKYSVNLDQGEHVKQLNFIDTPESEGRPTTIGDRAQFLRDYAPAFNARASDIERVAVNISGRQVIETYKVKTQGQETRTAKIVLDDLDRLISLSVE